MIDPASAGVVVGCGALASPCSSGWKERQYKALSQYQKLDRPNRICLTHRGGRRAEQAEHVARDSEFALHRERKPREDDIPLPEFGILLRQQAQA
jgi:hypothetical protein